MRGKGNGCKRIVGMLALLGLIWLLVGCGGSQILTVIPRSDGDVTEPSARKAEQMSLNIREATLSLGDSLLLVPVVYPSDATDAAVQFMSDNEAVATVDAKGRISGVGRGKTVIRAMSGEGRLQADCTVTVKGSQHYNEDGTVKVQGVTISRSSINLPVDGTAVITASVYPTDAYNPKITFLNSNTRSVQLEDDGTVVAIAPGTSVITAVSEDGQKTATCTVKVVCYMTAMDLSAKFLSIAPGKTVALKVMPTPANATNVGVVWSSSNPSVATVDDYGQVTAIANGSATITAKGVESKFSAKCQVTVEAEPGYVPMTNFTVKQSDVTVAAGEELMLLTTLMPSNTSERTLTFVSADPKVASVNSHGVIKGVKPGSTEVSISGKSGSIVRRCHVTVAENTVAHHLYMDGTSKTLKVNQSVTLDVGISSVTQPGEILKWSTSNSGVARVDQNGKVTAVSGGNATIYATLSESGYTASYRITVSNISVQSVAITPGKLELKPGTQAQLSAKITPADATVTAVEWESSDPGVAIVTRKGVVTAVSGGSAVITVTTADGKKKATCTVTVFNAEIKSLRLVLSELQLRKGEQYAMMYQAEPADIPAGLRWSSSNTKVVTVEEGLIIAVGNGSATVTATAGNGVKASCRVTVSSVAAQRIKLNKSSLSLKVGQSEQLRATVYPADATDRTVRFKSSHTAVVTVSADGTVKAVGKGSAVIEVSTADGKIVSRCGVTVE